MGVKDAPPRKRWIVRRIRHDFLGNTVAAGHDVYCYAASSMTMAVVNALRYAWLHEAVEVVVEDEWSPGEP